MHQPSRSAPSSGGANAPRPVTDALDRHAADRPGQLAVHDGATALTWAELRAAVDAQVARFVAAGIVPGQRVALIAPDGEPALISALAVLRLGAVHAPIDHTLAAPEIETALTALGVDWQVRQAEPGAPHAVRQVTPAVSSPLDPLGPGQSAFLRLSSGTTGAAKGVLLSHGTIAARIAAANDGLQLGPDDRMLWLLPMAYHFAVSVLLYVDRGCAIVFGNRLRATDTAAAARAAGCTALYASPWHLRRLAELPAGADLPAGLRLVVSTTTALDAGTAAAFRARHGLGVRQGLGIIEVGLPFLSPGEAGERPGQLGRPLPAFSVAILDAAGQPVAPGEAGELAIAGPGLLDAYLTPWRTRESILDHGFFRTGDLATVDGDGAVTLLGRLKDVINVGGVKVFPLEVETVLAAHPAVRGCRVSAGPDPRLGEQVVAEVELSVPVEPDALAAWCADRLAPLKRPGRITVVDRLPMTGSGKVKR